MKRRLHEVTTRKPAIDIKAGDYVELLGPRVRELFNGDKVIAMMKKTMNVLYVLNVSEKDKMMTLTPKSFVTSLKVLVPLSLAKYKLINVLE